MVKIKDKKTGFTIAEVLITMLIVSVFFVAMTKVIYTKPKPEVQDHKHGFYECYIKDGTLYQKFKTDFGASNLTEVQNCSFNPPQGIAYAVIYAISNNKVYSKTELQFNDTFTVNRSDLNNFSQSIAESENNSLDERDMQIIMDQYSGLLSVIKNASFNYSGPAIYIRW